MFDLTGTKALVVGVANDQSIAFGCAKALKAQGADLAITYLNEKAEPYVRPLAEEVGAQIIDPLDVRDPDQQAALFNRIEAEWGQIDTLIHSIAFCPKDDLHGRVIDSSAQGFGVAMDISVHSFLRLLRGAEPLMTHGGCAMTVSFGGADRVVADYNLMGPVKAALESAVRYAAAELGPKGIRVHTLSPGPLQTRAASGIEHFDAMIDRAQKKAPLGRLASIEDVGAVAAFLASPEAAGLTGGLYMIDGGESIID